DERMLAVEDKLHEKMKLFKNVEVLITERTDLIDNYRPKDVKWFTWSFNKTADVQFKRIDSILEIRFQNKVFSVSIPFNDLATIENMATCITVLLYLAMD